MFHLTFVHWCSLRLLSSVILLSLWYRSAVCNKVGSGSWPSKPLYTSPRGHGFIARLKRNKEKVNTRLSSDYIYKRCKIKKISIMTTDSGKGIPTIFQENNMAECWKSVCDLACLQTPLWTVRCQCGLPGACAKASVESQVYGIGRATSLCTQLTMEQPALCWKRRGSVSLTTVYD